MVYATMCIGEKWVDRHQRCINEFGKVNKIFVLTDIPTKFPNCETILYTRKIFSYYEKINLILQLSKEYKERIYYIDADWVAQYDTNLKVDSESIYSYINFDLRDDPPNPLTVYFTETEKQVQKSILKKIGVDKLLVDYLGEAILLFPYKENIDEIIADSKILQTYLEDIYNNTSITNLRLNRYKKGVGYAEGWGITALAVKYNIPIKEVKWRKKILL